MDIANRHKIVDLITSAESVLMDVMKFKQVARVPLGGLVACPATGATREAIPLKHLHPHRIGDFTVMLRCLFVLF